MPNQTKASAVTPCPVDWCPDAGHHAWDTRPSGEFSRLHEVKTRIGVATVVAVVYEDEEMDLAFGAEPLEPTGVTQAYEAEFEAALNEVIARAEHPQDVNRLVAAAIRLRKAAMPLD